MKIAFDAKRAAQNRTGLGNYSRLVVRVLSQQQPDIEGHLYMPNPQKTALLAEIPTLSKLQQHFPTTFWGKALRSLWRVWGITNDIRRDGMDIFHGLSNELPINIRKAGCKSVVTIHDLIFLHYPEYYKPIDRWIYNYKFRRACKNANRVIAISEFTKREIVRYYGTPEEKIDVVYQGCDPIFAKHITDEVLDEVRRRYGLPEKFLLFVGSIEERKNLMLVAKAMKHLRDRAAKTSAQTTSQSSLIPVVAVGKHTPYTEEIKRYLRENGLEDLFSFYHGVSYTDLPAFYRLATVFAYPSRIEGFGIPMLEAITSGTPAIGCTGSCLEEAGGPDCIYVDPDDEKAMATAIVRITTDKALRQQMITRGKDFAQRFNDHTLAADLMEVYAKL